MTRMQADARALITLKGAEGFFFLNGRGLSLEMTMRSNKDTKPLHMVDEREKRRHLTKLLRKWGGLRGQ